MRQQSQRRQPHVNLGVVHGALGDGEQFRAGHTEVAEAVERHLARVAVAGGIGSEFEQARANRREIFAPEADHQIGRGPSDIAVVVGHRLAQRVRAIHRKRARADLAQRIGSSPSHAAIGAGD